MPLGNKSWTKTLSGLGDRGGAVSVSLSVKLITKSLSDGLWDFTLCLVVHQTSRVNIFNGFNRQETKRRRLGARKFAIA
jgi:hypothetical protein